MLYSGNTALELRIGSLRCGIDLQRYKDPTGATTYYWVKLVATTTIDTEEPSLLSDSITLEANHLSLGPIVSRHQYQFDWPMRTSF